MATINHNWVSDYFKQRPQLKKPILRMDGYVIPPEWKHAVDKLLDDLSKQKPNDLEMLCHRDLCNEESDHDIARKAGFTYCPICGSWLHNQ